MNEQRRRAGAALLLAAALLPACAGLGVPASITLDEAELQAQLARRFPLQRSLLDSFDLELSDPQLQLRPADNRLATSLRLQGSDRRNGRRLVARVTLDYGLRYDAGDASVRLVQPRVEALELADADGAVPRRLAALQPVLAALAERWLGDVVLYRIPAERLERWRAAGYRPGALQVTPSGLLVTIEALP